MPGETGLTTKGEQTRALILESALALFETRGYEGTTMRAVAERAGVSVGNAYYYFRSKEHLIQAFYHRTHEEHLALCAPILQARDTLESRLLAAMEAKLDSIARYHRFAGVLFKSAADPESPLNPFSEASREVREEAIALFREVVEGASDRIPSDLREELPALLWSYHMGIILAWIYDRSPGQRKVRSFTAKSVTLIAWLLRLANLPFTSPLRRHVLGMIASLQGEDTSRARAIPLHAPTLPDEPVPPEGGVHMEANDSTDNL